ncbi:MAG TPA: globin domain-containing protein [Tepidisphaeraceae bacterium]|jgi:hemoglobin-like flavoprotein
MRKESLDRIRHSVTTLMPHVDDMTRLFYENLFAAAPDTRALFKVNMDVQRQHFAAALAVILRNLTMLDVLSEPLRELGIGHARIGVRPHHYPVVRDAMLVAMGQTLGDEWTPELAADWSGLLDKVSVIMMSGGTQELRST